MLPVVKGGGEASKLSFQYFYIFPISTTASTLNHCSQVILAKFAPNQLVCVSFLVSLIGFV